MGRGEGLWVALGVEEELESHDGIWGYGTRRDADPVIFTAILGALFQAAVSRRGRAGGFIKYSTRAGKVTV